MAFDKSFFFFCPPFPEDEEPRRNVAPSSRCENAVCLALSHLSGSFTLGSHTGTKAQHCFTLCFLLMATCCFSKAPFITSQWWCFRKISQDQRHLFGQLFDWCQKQNNTNALYVLAFIDLAKSFPHTLKNHQAQTYLLNLCVSVYVNLDVVLDQIWVNMALLDTQKQHHYDPDHPVETWCGWCRLSNMFSNLFEKMLILHSVGFFY